MLNKKNAISSVNGYTFNTNVGDFNLDQEYYDALVNGDRAFKQQVASNGTPQHEADKKLWQYWSTKANVLKSISDFNAGRTDIVPQEVLDVRLQNWQDNWEPLTSQYESQSGLSQITTPRPSGEDARGYAYNTLDYMGGNSSDLIQNIAQSSAAAKKADTSLGGKIVKTVVPLAIGTIGGALGGQALGLGTLSGLGNLFGGETGVAAGNTANLFNNFKTSTALSGALKGGAGGYFSGGDLSSALKGGLLGGITGGYGDAIGSTLGINSSAGLNAFTKGLTASSGPLASGDFKNAGLSAALAAGTGYITGGGKVPGFGTVQGSTLDTATGIDGLQGPTQGSGVLGSISRGLSNFTGGGISSFSGNNSSGLSNLSNALKFGGSIYGDYTNRQTNKDIEQRLLSANEQALSQIQPYQQTGLAAQNQLAQALAAGFNPQDLESDPGYQFQLAQGEKSLGRAMSASGMSQSGAALKAAQEYGQGLASTTFNDAYNRWLQNNSQLQGVANTGYNAAAGAGNLMANNGQVQAYRLNANQESKNQLIAALLGNNLFSQSIFQ